MPARWREESIDILGYVAKQTRATEEYVTLGVIQKLVDKGYNVHQIAQLWNQGNIRPCIAGINEHGAEYDSCDHQRKVVLAYMKVK